MQLDETKEQRADRKNKEFVIACYVLLLTRMLIIANVDKVKAVAEKAEAAMTKTTNIATDMDLREAVDDMLENIDHVQPVTLLFSIARFAQNIMGVLAYRGELIMDGTYTAEDFFKESVPSLKSI